MISVNWNSDVSARIAFMQNGAVVSLYVQFSCTPDPTARASRDSARSNSTTTTTTTTVLIKHPRFVYACISDKEMLKYFTIPLLYDCTEYTKRNKQINKSHDVEPFKSNIIL